MDHAEGDSSSDADGVQLVREAAAKGANIILLQELFETPYFCQMYGASWRGDSFLPDCDRK